MRFFSVVAASVLLVASLGGCSDDGDDDSGRSSNGGPAVDLGIHPVVAPLDSTDSEPSAEGNIVVDADGQALEVGPAALSAADVASAEAVTGAAGGWVVRVEFTDEGNEKFGDLTAEAACDDGPVRQRIVIVIDGEVASAPQVALDCGDRLEGGTDIAGDFTEESATELAEGINGDR